MMFLILVVIIILYLTTEHNLKVINDNIKELMKAVEELQQKKDDE